MKTMYSNAFLLGIALLMSATFTSAENTKVTTPAAGGAVSAQFIAAEMTPLGAVHILESELAGVRGTGAADSLSNGAISPISSLLFEPGNPNDKDGDDHDYDHDRDGDRDRYRDHGRDNDHDRKNVQPHDNAPTPAPEPLTALLFGAAMLIGGGVLRRRRRAGQH